MNGPTAAVVIFFLLMCVKRLLLSLTPLLRYDTHTHTHTHTHAHTHACIIVCVGFVSRWNRPYAFVVYCYTQYCKIFTVSASVKVKFKGSWTVDMARIFKVCSFENVDLQGVDPACQHIYTNTKCVCLNFNCLAVCPAYQRIQNVCIEFNCAPDIRSL